MRGEWTLFSLQLQFFVSPGRPLRIEVAFSGTFGFPTGVERTSRAVLSSDNLLPREAVEINGQENVNPFCKPQRPHTPPTPKAHFRKPLRRWRGQRSKSDPLALAQ